MDVIIETYEDGVLVDQETVTLPATTANAATLTEQARQALAANRTFLALASPTNAQTLAQVKALTRQVNALIRFELQDFTGTD